jgi:hypothetical protein
MNNPLNFPVLVFLVSFIALWLSTLIGIGLHKQLGKLDDVTREDFSVVRGATLTLLGLIVGFSFSLAVSRYDQRKNYEEEEANAIGTEYFRADLLPAGYTNKAKDLLVKYLDQRISFYQTRDLDQLHQINSNSAQLQDELWAVVSVPAAAQPTPVIALPVAGMNDVLNSQGYTQAAWWNRIPIAAWSLMGAIAIWSNILLGYGARSDKTHRLLPFVMPFIVSLSFFLIADIDSPRGGVIRVRPDNLVDLSHSLHPRAHSFVETKQNQTP